MDWMTRTMRVLEVMRREERTVDHRLSVRAPDRSRFRVGKRAWRQLGGLYEALKGRRAEMDEAQWCFDEAESLRVACEKTFADLFEGCMHQKFVVDVRNLKHFAETSLIKL